MLVLKYTFNDKELVTAHLGHSKNPAGDAQRAAKILIDAALS